MHFGIGSIPLSRSKLPSPECSHRGPSGFLHPETSTCGRGYTPRNSNHPFPSNETLRVLRCYLSRSVLLLLPLPEPRQGSTLCGSLHLTKYASHVHLSGAGKQVPHEFFAERSSIPSRCMTFDSVSVIGLVRNGSTFQSSFTAIDVAFLIKRFSSG